MSPSDAPPDGGRRPGDGLVFDAEAGRLSLGDGTISLAARGGNRVVLESYLDLVGSRRGHRPGSPAELREDDLDALTRALDLDAADLLVAIEAVLGASTDQAIGMLSHLQAHRILAGAGLIAPAPDEVGPAAG